MPSDDRERHFENALAGHLRASGAAGNPYGSCPDAETVAAYHEGSLDPQHTASLKTHLSDCQRCQQILAHLQSTDQIPAPATNAALLASPSTSAARVLPIRRPVVWRWVAPAGALAAALLVWIAVRQNTAVQVPVQGPPVALQRTENKVQAPPPPVSSPSLDATRSKQSVSSDQVSTMNPAPRSQTAQPKSLRQSLSKEKDSAAAKKASALDDSGQFAFNSPNPSKLPSSGRDLKSMSPRAVTQTVTVEPAPVEIAANQLPKSETEGQAANKRDASSPSPPPAPTSGVAGGVAAAAPAQPAERVQSMSETVEVTGAAVQQQHMEGMSRFDQKAEMRLAKALAEGIISAPDGRVSWRVGQAGVIQFSSDAGKTWTLQPSGVVVDLLAGSAPSDKVCWIVGRAGTILRTTDAGKHWQKTLAAPTQEDLHSVFAVNAHAATVSLANASYQTTDGGATWKKLPSQ